MNRREFIKATLAGLAATSAGGLAAARGGAARSAMVMLGFDGVDPRLVERWARHLPHLSRLATCQARIATTISSGGSQGLVAPNSPSRNARSCGPDRRSAVSRLSR